MDDKEKTTGHVIKKTSGGWLYVEVPGGYADGDHLPAPSSDDLYFKTEAEAVEHLLKKLRAKDPD